ncbi:MAG TPA: histidinol-phosphate transaminase [Blastocatellia bacterium]|nr:histidinol-phosphate transaminase [Blastocatellia bacterium]
MPISMTRRQLLINTGAVAAGLTIGRGTARAEWIPSSALPLEEEKVKVRARLNSNENPHGPSERARRAMTDAFNEGCRYPGGQNKKLEELIAKKEGLSPDQVILGAGSGEILRMAAMAYGPQGGELLTAHPTYEGLESAARTIGAFVHRVPLNKNFEHDLDMMDRRTTQAVRLVFVCNPNNPTGTIVPGDRLRSFCKEVSRRSVVLVDEAYHDYVEAPEYSSMIDLAREGHNVIISRTFSKIHAMAGLRVGYGFARPDIVARLRQFRNMINILGLQAAMASYQDPEFQNFSRRKNAEARSYLYKVLDELGYKYVPSHANFVFFKLGKDVQAQAFREAMEKKYGILVGRTFPPYNEYCRVSMGTMDEMKIFATALREVTREGLGAAKKPQQPEPEN